MAGSPDSYPVRSPDSQRNPRTSLDPATLDGLSRADPLAVGLGAASGFDCRVGEDVPAGQTITGRIAINVGEGSFLIDKGTVTDC